MAKLLFRHLAMMTVAMVVAVVASAPGAARQAADQLTARQILERAFEAQGGADWANVRTLKLAGTNTFYPKGTNEARVVADRYTMWRVMDENRTVAHGPDGKVRIDSFVGDKPMFQVAFDGRDTTTPQGVMPIPEAKTLWENNFGFGIIRQALKPGFTLVRLPDDLVDGHKVHVLRIIDPSKQETLFAFDATSFAIRKAGFMTPKGWHERIYSDFKTFQNPRWLQAQSIRLYYNGVLQNVLNWREVWVNPELPDSLFRLDQAATAAAP
jgi:hypothetical protein